MDNLNIKVEILLEHLAVRCKYYEDEFCERSKEYMFANCGGDITKCSLTTEDVKND